jgi:hypothetical protein
MAALRSCISGSPYIHDCAAAAHIASMARGDGPNTLSFAPMRARNGRPRMRSWASGPTKGTVAGRPAISGAKRGLRMEVRMSGTGISSSDRARDGGDRRRGGQRTTPRAW